VNVSGWWTPEESGGRREAQDDLYGELGKITADTPCATCGGRGEVPDAEGEMIECVVCLSPEQRAKRRANLARIARWEAEKVNEENASE